jgi:hypothetical protein
MHLSELYGNTQSLQPLGSRNAPTSGVESHLALMKRRREKSPSKSHDSSETVVRGVKSWRLPGAGAQEAQGGKFIHTWNEHKDAKKYKQGKWTVVEDTKLLELFDEYCAVHSLEGEARLKPLTDIAKGTSEQGEYILREESVNRFSSFLT